MELTSIEGQANKRPLVYYAVNGAYLPYALASCLNAQRTATRTDVDYAILAPSCDLVRKVKGTAERHNIKLFEITRKDTFSLRHCGIGPWDEAIHYLLLIDRFVPNGRELVLFMDADTLTVDGWDSIFDTDFEGNFLAARGHRIQDYLNAKSGDRLYNVFGLTDEQACSFNSGVVLFNYSEAISFRLFDKALSMVRTHPDRPNEQEALTVSVSGRIKRIEPIYNFVARPGVESIGEKIRHFAYVHKPWLLDKNGLVNTTRDAAIYRNLLGELGLSEYMDIPLKKGHRSIFKRLEKKLATFLYMKRYKRGKLQRR